MNFLKNKKGQAMDGGNGIIAGVSVLGALGLLAVIIGLVIAYGAQVQGEVRADMTPNSLEYNITTTSMENVENVSNKSGTVFTVALAAVILGILVTAFAGIFLYIRYFR